MITVDYIKQRHQYWAQKLYDLGIFKNMLKPITFKVKYGVKSMNGCYRRKLNSSNNIEESIVIYPKVGDNSSENLSFIDNILVHEMIHQYISNNKLKDTSSHGFIFKKYMYQINDANIGLKINVTDTFSKPVETNSYEIHKILVLKFDRKLFLCKVKSSKVNYFNELIHTHKINWKSPLRAFGWYKTNSSFFSNYISCSTRLHGITFPVNDFEKLIKDYGLEKFQVIEEL